MCRFRPAHSSDLSKQATFDLVGIVRRHRALELRTTHTLTAILKLRIESRLDSHSTQQFDALASASRWTRLFDLFFRVVLQQLVTFCRRKLLATSDSHDERKQKRKAVRQAGHRQKHSPNSSSEVFAARMQASLSSVILLPTHFSIMGCSIDFSMA